VDTRAVTRALVGIDISITAVLLALTSSGAGAFVIVLGLIGLFVCLSGMTMATKS
jgi:hypothetical protein